MLPRAYVETSDGMTLIEPPSRLKTSSSSATCSPPGPHARFGYLGWVGVTRRVRSGRLGPRTRNGRAPACEGGVVLELPDDGRLHRLEVQRELDRARVAALHRVVIPRAVGPVVAVVDERDGVVRELPDVVRVVELVALGREGEVRVPAAREDPLDASALPVERDDGIEVAQRDEDVVRHALVDRRRVVVVDAEVVLAARALEVHRRHRRVDRLAERHRVVRVDDVEEIVEHVRVAVAHRAVPRDDLRRHHTASGPSSSSSSSITRRLAY